MLIDYDVKNKRFMTFRTHRVVLRPTLNDLHETITYLVCNGYPGLVPELVRDFDNYNKRLLKAEEAFEKKNKELIKKLETSRKEIKDLEAEKQVLLDSFIERCIKVI